MDFLPFTQTLGSTGQLVVKSPVEQVIKKGIEYTVVAIRLITDVVISGEQIFENIYLPLGLTKDNYVSDLSKNITLISLQDSSGKIFKVPSEYILGYPVKTGVKYQDKTIALSLGSLPVDFDLSLIENELRNLVIEKLGILPEVIEVGTSKIYYVEEERDLIFRRKADALKANNVNPRLEIIKLQEVLNRAIIKINKLEAFIKLAGTELNLCNVCPDTGTGDQGNGSGDQGTNLASLLLSYQQYNENIFNSSYNTTNGVVILPNGTNGLKIKATEPFTLCNQC